MNAKPLSIPHSTGWWVLSIAFGMLPLGTVISILRGGLPLLAGSLLALLFGSVWLALLYAGIFCNPPLKLYEDHFEIKSPGVTRIFQWSDIERFELKRGALGGGDHYSFQTVAYTLTPEATKKFSREHPWAKRFENMAHESRSFDSLPIWLKTEPTELLRLVNDYKAKARV